jgi:hypothetical protein
MPETTEPAPGQVWSRNDPRDGGRQVEVLSVDHSFVHVKAVRRSRVRRENFVSAYTFVRAGEDTPDADTR